MRPAARLNADLSTIRMPLGSGTKFEITQGFNSTKKDATHTSENALNEHAIDITVDNNNADVPIVAIGTGKVIRVNKGITSTVTSSESDTSIYEGNSVYIRHTEEIDPPTGNPNPLYGFISIYGHLKNDNNLPEQGSEVKRGDRIGTMGNTGLSEGRHLHFSIVRYDYISRNYTTTEWSLGNTDKNADRTDMRSIESKKGEVDSDGQVKWGEAEED